MLVAHVIFGSVAILTCCLQVWPWLRARYPEVHRRIGLAYVFAGVLPAGVLGLVLGAQTPFGPVLRASNVLLALVWLFVTMAGYRAGRQYRTTEHRRWMTRSTVLTVSVISNRAWAVVWVITLSPQLATTFGGNEALMIRGHRLPVRLAQWNAAAGDHQWWLDTRRATRIRSRAAGRRTGDRGRPGLTPVG
jgi:hypothetical protein